jgi:hypothetical protein
VAGQYPTQAGAPFQIGAVVTLSDRSRRFTILAALAIVDAFIIHLP